MRESDANRGAVAPSPGQRQLRAAFKYAALMICLDRGVVRTEAQLEDAAEAAMAYWWERLHKRDGSPLIEPREDNPLTMGAAEVMARKLGL